MSIVNITHHNETIFDAGKEDENSQLQVKPKTLYHRRRTATSSKDVKFNRQHKSTSSSSLCCCRNKICNEIKSKTQEKYLEKFNNLETVQLPIPAPKFTLCPIYIKSRKYGKVPRYLKNMKRNQVPLVSQQNDNDESENMENSLRSLRSISVQEKEALLNGLQHNWFLMQQEYSKMPLLIDTVTKILRKTKLENELKSIEKDICMLKSDVQNCELNLYVKPQK